MAFWTYYQTQPYITGWRRWAVGLSIAIISVSIGTYYEGLMRMRYSTFVGRTSLYGDTTVRNGWINSEKDNESTDE